MAFVSGLGIVLLACAQPLISFDLEPIDRVVGWLDPHAGNAKDTWKIDVPNEGALIVTLMGMDWDKELDLVVFDSNGEYIQASNKPGCEWEAVVIPVPPGGGTYYVQIRARGSGDATGYILRSFATPASTFLLFQDEESVLPEEVFETLGIKNYETVSDLTGFKEALEEKEWDVIIVYNVSISADQYTDELRKQLQGGGAVIVFDPDLKEDVQLLDVMDAVWLGEISITLEESLIQGIPTTTLWTNPNVFDSLEGIVLGCAVQAIGSGRAAAIYESRLGVDMIIISNGGRGILNSFDLELFGDDGPSLLTNELVYTLLALQWQGFEQMDWWYEAPVERASEYIESAKFSAAMDEIDEALCRLIPASPVERIMSYAPEDFFPGPEDEIASYQEEIGAVEKLLLRVADLVEVITVFFNQVRITDVFKEFTKEVSRRMESATVWLEALKAGFDMAQRTGLGVYTLPPGPVLTNLYPAYSTVEGLSVCTLEIVNHSPQTQSLTVMASVPGFTTTQTLELTLPPKTARWVNLNPALLPELSESRSTRAGMLHLQAGEQTFGPFPIEFLPINEFPDYPSFYPYLIALITPTDPAIEEFVSEALKDLQDTTDVEAKAKALWNALEEMGFHYLDAQPAYTAWTQRIRLPADALAEKGGNCLEGSLLMASLLEAAGVNPLILLIPAEQHAMVGWQSNTGEYKFLETTFLDTALYTFDIALLYGTNHWVYDYSKKKMIRLEKLVTEDEIDIEAVYLLEVTTLRHEWNITNERR